MACRLSVPLAGFNYLFRHPTFEIPHIDIPLEHIPDMPSAEPSKPLSISLVSKSKLPPSKSVKPAKCARSRLVDDSDSDHESAGQEPKLFTIFDRSAGGAIDLNAVKQEKKGPLIIPSQKDKDWREEAQRKRGRNLLPEEEQARREGRQDATDEPVDNGQENTYGLVVLQGTQTVDQDGDVRMDSRDSLTAAQVHNSHATNKTVDEEALEALLGEKQKSGLIIPNNSEPNGDRLAPRISEAQAFRLDVQSRPESASLEDYAAIPIEEFGLALLRGMGYKEGDPIGKNGKKVVDPKVLERRPGLLGIGAKEAPEGLEELGAWGKGAKDKKKGPKIDRNYMPVVLKNSKTGEILTEEELQAKKDTETTMTDNWRKRRDRDSGVSRDEGRYTEPKYQDHEQRRGDGRREKDSSTNRRKNYENDEQPPARSDRSRSPARRRHKDRTKSPNRRRDRDRSRSPAHRRDRDRSRDRRRRDERNYRNGDVSGYQSREDDRDHHRSRYQDRKGHGDEHSDSKRRNKDRSRRWQKDNDDTRS